jgi:hypothetical protein
MGGANALAQPFEIALTVRWRKPVRVLLLNVGERRVIAVFPEPAASEVVPQVAEAAEICQRSEGRVELVVLEDAPGVGSGQNESCLAAVVCEPARIVGVNLEAGSARDGTAEKRKNDRQDNTLQTTLVNPRRRRHGFIMTESLL